MKSIKITFTDNFLTNFQGNQEDLDAIVQELTDKFHSGEFEGIVDGDIPELTVSESVDDFVEQHPRVLH